MCVGAFFASAGNDTQIVYANNTFESVMLGDARTTGSVPLGEQPAPACPSGDVVCVTLDNYRGPFEELAAAEPERFQRPVRLSYFTPANGVQGTREMNAVMAYRTLISQYRLREGASIRWSFAVFPAFNATTVLELRPQGVDDDHEGITIAFDSSVVEMAYAAPVEVRRVAHGPPPNSKTVWELDEIQFEGVYNTTLAEWPTGRWLGVDVWLHTGEADGSVQYAVWMDGKRMGQWPLLSPPEEFSRMAISVEAPYETNRTARACVDEVSMVRYGRELELGDARITGAAAAARLARFERRATRKGAYTEDLIFQLDFDGLDLNSTRDMAEFESADETELLPPAGPSRGVYSSDLAAHVWTDLPPACPNKWVSYAWDMLSLPEGGAFVLNYTENVEVLFTPQAPGRYVLGFTARSNCALVDDIVEVDVLCNNPPTPSVQALLSDWAGYCYPVVDLFGNESFDLDGDDIQWSWSWVRTPNSSRAAELPLGTAPNSDSRPDALGVFGTALVVSDGCSTSEVMIEYAIAWEDKCLALGDERQERLTLLFALLLGAVVAVSFPYLGPISVRNVRNLTLDVRAVLHREVALRRLGRAAAARSDEKARAVAMQLSPASKAVEARMMRSPTKARGAFVAERAHRAISWVSMNGLGFYMSFKATPQSRSMGFLGEESSSRRSPGQWLVDVLARRRERPYLVLYVPSVARQLVVAAIAAEPLQLLLFSFRAGVPPFPYKLPTPLALLSGVEMNAGIANIAFGLGLFILFFTTASYPLLDLLPVLLRRTRPEGVESDKYAPAETKKKLTVADKEDEVSEAASDVWGGESSDLDGDIDDPAWKVNAKSAARRYLRAFLLALMSCCRAAVFAVPLILPELLFQPIISAFLGRVTCQYRNQEAPFLHWDKDPAVACFVGMHFTQVVFAMLGCAMLVVATLVIATRRHEVEYGVRVLPAFVALQTVCKTLMAGLGVAYESARRATADPDFRDDYFWFHDMGILAGAGTMLVVHLMLQSVRGMGAGVACVRTGGYAVATLAAAMVVWHKLQAGQPKDFEPNDDASYVTFLFWAAVGPTAAFAGLAQWGMRGAALVPSEPTARDVHASRSMNVRAVAWIARFSVIPSMEKRMDSSLKVSPVEAATFVSLVVGVIARDPLGVSSPIDLLAQLGVNLGAFAGAIEDAAIHSDASEAAKLRAEASAKQAASAVRRAATEERSDGDGAPLPATETGACAAAERTIAALVMLALDPRHVRALRRRWVSAVGVKATTQVVSALRALAVILDGNVACSAAISEAIVKLSVSEMVCDLILLDDIRHHQQEASARETHLDRLARAWATLRECSIWGVVHGGWLLAGALLLAGHEALSAIFNTETRLPKGLLSSLVEQAGRDDSASDAALRALSALARRGDVLLAAAARGVADVALRASITGGPASRSTAGVLLSRCAQEAPVSVVASVVRCTRDASADADVGADVDADRFMLCRALDALESAAEAMPIPLGTMLSTDDMASVAIHIEHADSGVRLRIVSVIASIALCREGYAAVSSLRLHEALHSIEVRDEDASVRMAARHALERIAQSSVVGWRDIGDVRRVVTRAEADESRRAEVGAAKSALRALTDGRLERDERRSKGRVRALIGAAHGEKGNGLPRDLLRKPAPKVSLSGGSGGDVGTVASSSAGSSSGDHRRAVDATVHARRQQYAQETRRREFIARLGGL